MDLRPPLEPMFRDFGLVTTVTVPGGSPISARGVWINPQTVEVPIGAEARVVEPRHLLALWRDEVTSIPSGTRIDVAEHTGAPVRQWRVDGFGRVESEIIEVILVPA